MNDKKNNLEDLNILPIDEELDKEALAAQQAQEDLEDELGLKIKLSSRRDERHLAFYLLYAIDRSDYELELADAIDDFEQAFECTIPRLSFPVLVAKGVVEQREQFDQQLLPHLKNWRLERIGCCTKLILHIAMWELTRPGAIPSIVINEAIELAKEFAEKDAYKFINGILDEMTKKKNEDTTNEILDDENKQ
ncbi:transcription antitermination factor NusB [Candidatus Dependentiae bacterium]|nr:transcription antitermination factor NusB [Candidatus Dependentiae bacterium]